MRPLVGAWLDGASLADVDERGGVGTPAWGPAGLLRDLELRLGLTAPEVSPASRIAAWRRRLAALLDDQPFYAGSFRVDPLGTSEMLLGWRDALIDGGWDGSPVPGGGARLAVFAQLEALPEPLPRGGAERLARVDDALLLADATPYPTLTLAGDLSSWPGRWRRVVAALERCGTRIDRLPEERAAAPADSDLGRLQTRLAQDRVATTPTPMRGDGSLLLLEAPTTLEAAEAVAALARTWTQREVAFIRGGEPRILNHGLLAQGLPGLGERATSPWRAAAQLLPLLIDLSFTPPDPRRLLELLDLRVNPLSPRVRHSMARALSDSPGIGDVRWQRARQRLIDDGESVDGIAQWLEISRFDPDAGAPRDELLALTHRIATWLRERPAGPDAEVIAAAHGQCQDFVQLVESDPRARLDRVAVRQLLDAATASGVAMPLAPEQAGRFDHVDAAGALLCTRDHVVWWHFVASSTRPPHRMRWRHLELEALAAAGVDLVAPAAILAEESRSWRAAVQRARRNLVLVAPLVDRGEPMTRHPFWDELAARLHLPEAQLARITVTSGDLLARRRWHLEVERLPHVELPEERTLWRLPPGALTLHRPLAPYAVQELLECPLRWVLGSGSPQRARSVPVIPEGSHLNGVLGHRLVESLVADGALPTDPAVIGAAFDRLLPGVAATLLLPGMSLELHQLRHQLVAAVTELALLLRRAGLEIAAVEEDLGATWLGVELAGRLDLRLRSPDGDDAILDLKWSRGFFRDQLRDGRALQLALYGLLVRERSPGHHLPATGYFFLSRGQLLTTEPARFGQDHGVTGPSSQDVIDRVRRTLPLVGEALAAGAVPVTGVDGSVPLLEALGVPASEHEHHFASDTGVACGRCGFGAVCGRAWSSFR